MKGFAGRSCDVGGHEVFNAGSKHLTMSDVRRYHLNSEVSRSARLTTEAISHSVEKSEV